MTTFNDAMSRLRKTIRSILAAGVDGNTIYRLKPSAEDFADLAGRVPALKPLAALLAKAVAEKYDRKALYLFLDLLAAIRQLDGAVAREGSLEGDLTPVPPASPPRTEWVVGEWV